MMCEGSTSLKGNRKPVALVRMVKAKKIAVSPGVGFEPSRPNITMMPAAMAIRLMMTWTSVKAGRLNPRTMAFLLRSALRPGE